MSSLSIRNETGICPCCEEGSDSCFCFTLLSWEGTHLMSGEDAKMDALITWGVALSFQSAPPAFDSPVLSVLPIHFAKAIEAHFLKLAAECGCPSRSCAEAMADRYEFDEFSECRKAIYRDWVLAAAIDVHDESRCIDSHSPGCGGHYDNIEVENPHETSKRMSAILAPASAALALVVPPE